MSTRAEVLTVGLGFALLALVTTYPLVLVPGTHLPSDLGDPLLNTWTLAWDASKLAHGLRGLWDAPNFFPYHRTVLYSEHLLGIAFFTAPLQWATGNPVLVYNIAFLASVAFSGIAMYALARSLTGRRDAALVAGVIYACLPFRASHLAHLQWSMIGWLPLGLWGLHRYFVTRGWRHLALAAACFFLQTMTSMYFLYFALLPFGIVAGVEILRGRERLRESARQVAAVSVLLALAIAPVAWADHDVRQEYGLRRSAEDIASQSADVADYFRAAPRLRWWGRLGTTGAEHELFPGVITLGLAAVAMLRIRRSRAIASYAAIALIAFVLSLGSTPAAWGHALGIPGPYAWLLRVVPGLDGIRAVARLGLIVAFALTVLAAFGTVRLVDRFGWRGRLPALAILACGIVAEGWAAPIPAPAVEPFTGPDQQTAYEYLRQAPPGAVIELPTSLGRVEREARYQFLTLFHGHPIVNGHSGYVSPLAGFLAGPQSPLNEVDRLGDTVHALRVIGIRYLVIHHESIDDPSLAEAWRSLLTPENTLVAATRQFGRTQIVALVPSAPGAAPAVDRPIDAAMIHMEASHSPERVPFLVDGDPDSRWLSGRPQRGDEWIRLDFDRPRDVSRVRLRMAQRSLGDYPRDLAIDSIGDHDATLFRGSVLPALLQGLVADGNYPDIDVMLPPNRSKTLVLRQLGHAGRFFWSIHELRAWER